MLVGEPQGVCSVLCDRGYNSGHTADRNQSVVVEIPELKRRRDPDSASGILKERIRHEGVGFAVLNVQNRNLAVIPFVQTISSA